VAQQYRLTSIGVNPAVDRAYRMRMYFIMMSIRVACVASLFFVRGWWIILVGAGAVILPYAAVLIANQRDAGAGTSPEAPLPPELNSSMPVSESHGADALIVIDSPSERRTSSTAPSRGPEDVPSRQNRESA